MAYDNYGWEVTQETSFCPNCGRAVRPGADFCGYCGFKTAAQVQRDPAPQRGRKGQDIRVNYLYALLIGAALLAITAFLCSSWAGVMGVAARAATGGFIGIISIPVIAVFIVGAIFISNDAKSNYESRIRHESILSVVAVCIQAVWLLLAAFLPIVLIKAFNLYPPVESIYLMERILRSFAITAFIVSVASVLVAFLVKKTLLGVILPYAVCAAICILVMLLGLVFRWGIIPIGICMGVIEPIVLLSANAGHWIVSVSYPPEQIRRGY